MPRPSPFSTFSGAALALCLWQPVSAAPRPYVLDTLASTVAFEAGFGPDKITGDMPVERADLILDFQNVSGSQLDVVLDVGAAKASFPFAAQALKGPKVLDADSHPTITFHSTSVTPTTEGASVRGDLTIRGVTHPVDMTATIWRKAGSEAGDLSHLTVRMTGAVLRSAFGATGWGDLVGDEVRLIITAKVVVKP